MGPSTIVTAVLTYGSSLAALSLQRRSDTHLCSFLAAWPYTRTYYAIIPIAVLYGMSSGAFVSLIAAPLLSLGKPNEVGERSGLMFTIVAFGALCGPPISGAIQKATEGWEFVGIYAGKCREAPDEGQVLT